MAKRIIFDKKVPRFYVFNKLKGDIVELHIFTDSLQLAYGTCPSVRIIQGNDIKILVIIGRSRLAPLNSKVLTIPKLELQSAVIASRMKCKMVDEFQITVNDIYIFGVTKVCIFPLNMRATIIHVAR